MLNLKSIFVIVHDFLDENIFRKSEKVVIQRIQMYGASGGLGLLKMGVAGGVRLFLTVRHSPFPGLSAVFCFFDVL